MTRNKILGAAIAAALSMGGGTAQAASTFEIVGCDGAGAPGYPCTITIPARPTSPDDPKVATEVFDPDATTDMGLTLPATNDFVVMYDLNDLLTDNLNADVDVLFTLSGNAQFEDGSYSGNFLKVTDDDGDNDENVIAGTDNDTNNIGFVVQANSGNEVPKDAFMVLQPFKIDVTESEFATAGQKVTLTITLSGGMADSKTVTLIESTAGTKVTFTPEPTSGADNSKVDVDEAGTLFTPGISGAGTVDGVRTSLGTVGIDLVGTVPYTEEMKENTSNKWTFAAGNLGSDSKLILSNGPFGSLPAKDDADIPAHVFLDTDGATICDWASGTLDTDRIEADEIDGDTATWDLTADQLVKIATTDTHVCIEVHEDNTAGIDVMGGPISALLQIDYKSGNVLSYPGILREVKRNGAVCTVYFAIGVLLDADGNPRGDTSSIRISNKSSDDANLIVTMRDENGNVLIDKGVPPEMPVIPKQTYILNTAKLAGMINTDVTDWKYGGIVTISANVNPSDLAVYNVVRKVGDSTGTLMNMSVPGTGNGCD